MDALSLCTSHTLSNWSTVSPSCGHQPAGAHGVKEMWCMCWMGARSRAADATVSAASVSAASAIAASAAAAAVAAYSSC